MWHDEDLDDREWPDDDGSEDGDDETVPCPHCRKPVYEDAERCPSCGAYLSREDVPWRRPVWLIVGVIAGLVIVAYWTFR
jgi:hypothetical protein